MIAIGAMRPHLNRLQFHAKPLCALRASLVPVTALDDTELADAARECLEAMAALETSVRDVIDLLSGRIEIARRARR